MEVLIAVGALAALGTLAYAFGHDSRDNHDRAIDAARRGDLGAVRKHVDDIERDIARTSWAA